MTNLLLQEPQYKVTTSERGTWRRHLHPNGNLYAEFTSSATVLGMPLFHYTRGISPETGSIAISRGFVAVGHRAIGVIAIGRMAAGVIAIGQLCVGVFGLGQLAIGLAALGQIALGAAVGVGQLATGFVCIAQVGFGNWVLAQVGAGRHVWSMRIKDPAAIDFFRSLANSIGLRDVG